MTAERHQADGQVREIARNILFPYKTRITDMAAQGGLEDAITAALHAAVAAEREACAAIVGDRKVWGYMPDLGCIRCFEAIVDAIQARK